MFRNFVLSSLPLLLLSACGFSAEPPAAAPAPVRTEAREVTLEEHDTSGRLLWSVRSSTVTEESAQYDCDSITLIVSDPAADPATLQNGNAPHSEDASLAWRVKLGTGLEANAAKGRIERETSPTTVHLNEGFALRLGTGWEARGASMTWDGAKVVADGAFRLDRPGVSITADRAVIVPSTNRIALDRVKGVVDGIAL